MLGFQAIAGRLRTSTMRATAPAKTITDVIPTAVSVEKSSDAGSACTLVTPLEPIFTKYRGLLAAPTLPTPMLGSWVSVPLKYG